MENYIVLFAETFIVFGIGKAKSKLGEFFEIRLLSHLEPPMILSVGIPKKRERTATHRSSSTVSTISSVSDVILTEISQQHHRPSSMADDRPSPMADDRPSPMTDDRSTSSTDEGLHFNDVVSADVVLRLFMDSPSPLQSLPTATTTATSNYVSNSDFHVYLNSDVQASDHVTSSDGDRFLLNLGVSPATGSIQSHLTVLELLYTNDFASVVDSAATALDLLLVPLELLFKECVHWCVDFLEVVPWTEEEEKRVVRLIPFLSEEESKELMARVLPSREDLCESMLEGLVSSMINSYGNTTFVKAFVGKILRDLSSRETTKKVLKKAFARSLKTVKEL
ncbi:hypothetical protein V8G54_009690 [Vigna mungo]|uniref:Uncharacterized protein n=1 Tax=Vigna mungo TaxID=3915 RepID=A0AAQ3NW85_VIGMU